MSAGSLRNIGEPKFRAPEIVTIGNNPPPTTPPGMFVAPVPPFTTWLDLENREYSEFQISVDINFHITTVHAHEGARFKLFVYRSTDSEIAVDINPWQDEQIRIPGASVSKVYVLNVECYLQPGGNKLRNKVTNLIFDNQARKDKTWSSSRIKETVTSLLDDDKFSPITTWSSQKIAQILNDKQDLIGNTLEVDEIVRKANSETGGLTLVSKSIHKNWGDREDEYPGFKFIMRVFDGNDGKLVFEEIPFFTDTTGQFQISSLNAQQLRLKNSTVATEGFVKASVQAIADLMSTDSERLAAINELTKNYNAADEQLQQTLTTALATKSSKTSNEEISGIWNFLNGLRENGVSLQDKYLGKSATANNALKLGGFVSGDFPKKDKSETINGVWLFKKDLRTNGSLIGDTQVSTMGRFQIRKSNNYHTRMELTYVSSLSAFVINCAYDSDTRIFLQPGGGYGKRTEVDANGNLIVRGNLTVSGAISSSSDRRLKTNIQPLKPRGELNPVTFLKDGKPGIGFIAQEVKEFYPELVAGEEKDDSYLSLNYSQLTAVLYAEIKELKREVKHLKELIP